MRYPKVGENKGRKTTSVQRNENILLMYLGGCKILRDSMLMTGMKTNKKRMNGRYKKFQKISQKVFCNRILESHLAGDGVLSSHRVQHQGGGCSRLKARTYDMQLQRRYKPAPKI